MQMLFKKTTFVDTINYDINYEHLKFALVSQNNLKKFCLDNNANLLPENSILQFLDCFNFLIF
jgi:hypothetical protein